MVPPNVVLVIADDLGYGDLGSYGSSIMRTPHLDRLANGGIRFTDAYVAAAVCSPSRAGLMTGRYPQRHGYEFNTSGRDVDVGLSTEETTLGDLMTQARYATGYIGKWHLGKRYEHHPLSRGFGEYFGVLAGATIFIEDGHPDAVHDPLRPIGTRDEREIYRAPHTPLQAMREDMAVMTHVEDLRTRIYATMVSTVDRGVGALVERLEHHDIADDTFIVFMSDNGCVGYASIACSSGPFNGSKRFQLEGGIRIPLIMHWPNGFDGGRVFRDPVISLDLFARLLTPALMTR